VASSACIHPIPISLSLTTHHHPFFSQKTLSLPLSPANPRTPIAILGAGTPHKPPPHDPGTGRELWECTAGARYLRDRHGLDLLGGVGGGGASSTTAAAATTTATPDTSAAPAPALLPPPVLKEAASFDTVGNALFALTTHALPAGWCRLAVVTSSWHAERAAAIFDRVFGLANRAFRASGEVASPAAATSPPPFSLSYHATADDSSFPPDVLAARAGREAASTAAWEAATGGFSSLADLHAWVHATHLCYAAARQEEFGVPAAVNAGVDPKALASY
jgi:hypothetical protein